jgi:hypothetical protein
MAVKGNNLAYLRYIKVVMIIVLYKIAKIRCIEVNSSFKHDLGTFMLF